MKTINSIQKTAIFEKCSLHTSQNSVKMRNKMKTIEEKAYSHVDKIFSEIIDKYQSAPWNEFREALARIYLAGATEALASQWRKYPDEDFPDTGSEYIVLTESGDFCAVNKYAKKEEVKQYTNIIAWMPLPEPPKDESHV